jgi:serine O-acetyltransferase
MKLSIAIEELNYLVVNQLNNLFNDGNLIDKDYLMTFQKKALRRLEKAISHTKLKYYYQDNKPFFNHLHSDHYSMYLYLLSNTIWQINQDIQCASKLFLLNKALHGIDVFYSVELPEIFSFVHPVGTVLGHAKYSDYFVVYQNCTVGSTKEGIYPNFESEIVLYAGARVIGKCNVGSNVIFGACSFIIDTDVESNKVILKSFPDNKIIENTSKVKDTCFNDG